jgi:hypothetical protein
MSNFDSYRAYANSVYNNLKTYVDTTTNKANLLDQRIITNYGVVESGGISISTILGDSNPNSFIDNIMTGNPYKTYTGRTSNRYPNVIPSNGSTGYLITTEGATNNVYTALKNQNGIWEVWGIASNVTRTTIGTPV